MDQPFVTSQIYGQLGNQLFQIAATLAYSWDYQAIPLFPGLHNPSWNISYNRDKLFSHLNTSMPPRPVLNLFKESSWCSAERIPFYKDLLIDGYFQSWKHFHHHRTKILKTFSPSLHILSDLSQKYGDLLDKPNTVGIHVRTQSKRTHDAGIHPFWGMPYYEKALNLFPQDSIFIICSDRINWCKKHFSPLQRNFIYAEGNDGISDLFLLSLCKHNILCNSSYSWWAAYLNQHDEAKIIFPKDWQEKPTGINPNPRDFFLDQWTLIDSLRKPAYPFDMFYYDKTSQSVDNQNN